MLETDPLSRLTDILHMSTGVPSPSGSEGKSCQDHGVPRPFPCYRRGLWRRKTCPAHCKSFSQPQPNFWSPFWHCPIWFSNICHLGAGPRMRQKQYGEKPTTFSTRGNNAIVAQHRAGRKSEEQANSHGRQQAPARLPVVAVQLPSAHNQYPTYHPSLQTDWGTAG